MEGAKFPVNKTSLRASARQVPNILLFCAPGKVKKLLVMKDGNSIFYEEMPINVALIMIK